ncbi:MAG: OmpH family outer membrane protein [Rikenellaceae bacterium]
MKKIVLLFVAVLGVTAIASAQKIGQVRTNQVMMSLPEMDSVQIKFDAYQAEMQKEYEVMIAEYQKKYQDYEDTKDNLSSILLNQKEQELQDAQRRIQNYQTDATTESQNIQNSLLAPITAKIKSSIDKIAKTSGLTLVLESDMVNTMGSPFPYADPSVVVDITNLVIKDLGGKAL